MADMDLEFVHLARLALAGKQRDIAALLRRDLQSLMQRRPDLAKQSRIVLSMLSEGAVTRALHQPLPVDLDSKQELIRSEIVGPILPEPVWQPEVNSDLVAVLQERQHEQELIRAGLSPTRSILFVGPPGVGKTLAARWLASQLDRPLLTLDLAAVMSSYLGRTGNNIRVVLEFAKKSPSVLLLDEFDAIAKRRDDDAEVGELKRLVTVLLQTVDEWPSDGILIAATNHPELLDPAAWRRFERIVRFPHPRPNEIKTAIARILGEDELPPEISWLINVLSHAMEGSSFAEVARLVTSARRETIIRGGSLEESLTGVLEKLKGSFDRVHRLRIAKALANHGFSRREISVVTGISRDTFRKHEQAGATKTVSDQSKARAGKAKLTTRKKQSKKPSSVKES